MVAVPNPVIASVQIIDPGYDVSRVEIVDSGSPDAALHIGPQHVVLETAATDLAADVAGTRKLQVVSWHVMFISRGNVGPFRVEGTAHPGGPGTRRRPHAAARRGKRGQGRHFRRGNLGYRRLTFDLDAGFIGSRWRGCKRVRSRPGCAGEARRSRSRNR
jgi:hypothetical protein